MFILNQKLLLSCLQIKNIEIPVPSLLLKDVATRRPCEIGSILTQLSLSKLPPVGAIRINNPDLVGSTLIGGERDSLAIRRPAGAGLGDIRGCQL